MSQLPPISDIALFVLVTLVSITLHEAAHAYAALKLGDDTAFKKGRVTLNPLAHIDPIGTVILPAALLLSQSPFIFGYAKPVPVKWSRLTHPRRDMMIVAVAGPLTNAALAMLSFLLLLVTPPSLEWGYRLLNAALSLNVLLAIFNLLPVPPLDGSKIVAGLLPARISAAYLRLARFGVFLPIAIVVALVFGVTWVRTQFQ